MDLGKNPFRTSLGIVFWQNSRYPSENVKRVSLSLRGLRRISAALPPGRGRRSPLLRGPGQRLGALGRRRGLSGRLLAVAARLEEVRVDEHFPKTPLVDDPTADLLPFPVGEI